MEYLIKSFPKLNHGQSKIVARVVAALDGYTEKPLRLIVQGEAGTGKSF